MDVEGSAVDAGAGAGAVAGGGGNGLRGPGAEEDGGPPALAAACSNWGMNVYECGGMGGGRSGGGDAGPGGEADMARNSSAWLSSEASGLGSWCEACFQSARVRILASLGLTDWELTAALESTMLSVRVRVGEWCGAGAGVWTAEVSSMPELDWESSGTLLALPAMAEGGEGKEIGGESLASATTYCVRSEGERGADAGSWVSRGQTEPGRGKRRRRRRRA